MTVASTSTFKLHHHNLLKNILQQKGCSLSYSNSDKVLKRRKKELEERMRRCAFQVPHDFKESTLRHTIVNKKKEISPDQVTALILLFVYDHKDSEKNYNFTIDEFQKAFSFIDVESVSEEDKAHFLPLFNRLIENLTSGLHPFGNIRIDESWTIVEGNSVDISNYLLDTQQPTAGDTDLNAAKEIEDDKDKGGGEDSTNDIPGDPPIIDDTAKPSTEPLPSDPIRKSLKYYLGSVLAVISVILILGFSNPNYIVGKVTGWWATNYSDVLVPECAFDKSKDKYKVLIMPFPDEGYSKSDLPIGEKIKRRLVELSDKDSLNLEVHYCDKFIEKDVSSKYFEKVMLEHNADQIIYGYTESSKNGDGDLISLKYISKISPDVIGIESNDAVVEPKYFTLEGIRKGDFQEEIDVIIYYSYLIKLSTSSNSERTLYYANYLIDSLGVKTNPTLYFLRGVAKNNVGNYRHAIEDLTKGLNSCCYSESDIYAIRSQCFYNLNKLDSALIDAEIAISLDPESALAYYMRTNILLMEKRTPDCEGILSGIEKGYSITGITGVQFFYGLAYCYYFNGPIDSATYFCQIAIDGFKKYEDKTGLPLFLGLQSRIYLKQKKYNEAIRYAKLLISSEPNKSENYMLLSDGYLLLGEYDSSVYILSLAIGKNSLSQDLFLARGEAYLAAGNFKNSLKDFKKAHSLDNHLTINELSQIAAAYMLKGEYDSSLILYEQIISTVDTMPMSPMVAKCYYDRSIAYAFKKDYSKSIKDINKCLNYDSSNSDFYFHRCKMYKEIGWYDLAWEDLLRVDQDLNSNVRLTAEFQQMKQYLKYLLN